MVPNMAQIKEQTTSSVPTGNGANTSPPTDSASHKGEQEIYSDNSDQRLLDHETQEAVSHNYDNADEDATQRKQRKKRKKKKKKQVTEDGQAPNGSDDDSPEITLNETMSTTGTTGDEVTLDSRDGEICSKSKARKRRRQRGKMRQQKYEQDKTDETKPIQMSETVERPTSRVTGQLAESNIIDRMTLKPTEISPNSKTDISSPTANDTLGVDPKLTEKADSSKIEPEATRDVTNEDNEVVEQPLVNNSVADWSEELETTAVVTSEEPEIAEQQLEHHHIEESETTKVELEVTAARVDNGAEIVQVESVSTAPILNDHPADVEHHEHLGIVGDKCTNNTELEITAPVAYGEPEIPGLHVTQEPLHEADPAKMETNATDVLSDEHTAVNSHIVEEADTVEVEQTAPAPELVEHVAEQETFEITIVPVQDAEIGKVEEFSTSGYNDKPENGEQNLEGESTNQEVAAEALIASDESVVVEEASTTKDVQKDTCLISSDDIERADEEAKEYFTEETKADVMGLDADELVVSTDPLETENSNGGKSLQNSESQDALDERPSPSTVKSTSAPSEVEADNVAQAEMTEQLPDKPSITTYVLEPSPDGVETVERTTAVDALKSGEISRETTAYTDDETKTSKEECGCAACTIM